MREIRLTLKGTPPSLNRFAGRQDVWSYRDAKKTWTDFVLWELRRTRQTPPEPFERADVEICYHFPDSRRRDPDNYCGKLLLDGLTAGGVIVDDDFKHIRLTVRGEVDRTRPRTEITVMEEKKGE